MITYNFLKRLFKNYTEIDFRSFVALRVGLAIAGLLDLFISRFPQAEFFLSDKGVLPRKLIVESTSFSIFLADGSLMWSYVLLTMMTLSCLTLLIGFNTRTSIIIYYLMFLSLHWRTEFLLGGPDRLHLLITMWALFLPLGSYASMDALKKFSSVYPKNLELKFNERLASFGLILLIATMFLMAAFFKLPNADWYSNFNALYYVINTGYHVTPLGYLIRDQILFNKILTFSTLVFEWGIGILLLIPFKVKVFRGVAAVTLFFLKFGFGLVLFVSLFPVLGITMAFYLLPSNIWDRLFKNSAMSNRFEKVVILFSDYVSPLSVNLGTSSRYLSGFVSFILVYNIYLHLISNLDDLVGWELGNSATEKFSKKYLRLFRIDQKWVMFKNAPRWSAWPEVIVNLEDGTQKDIWRKEWQGTDEVSRVGPVRPATGFLNSLRLFLYFSKLSQPEKNGTHHLFYADYICKKWNGSHVQKIKSIDYFYNYTHWDDVGVKKVKGRKFIWNYECPAHLNNEDRIFYKY